MHNTKPQRLALVVANGPLPDGVAQLAKFAAVAALRVAVDGGARHFMAAGLTPHFLVGDLDSLPAAEADALQKAGVQVLRHPARKDATDLELALDVALAQGADDVVVLAALGAAMAKFSMRQQLGSSSELAAAKAMQAANAGLEWANFQVLRPAAAPACFGATHIALTGNLSDFVVSISCNLSSGSDGGSRIHVRVHNAKQHVSQDLRMK